MLPLPSGDPHPTEIQADHQTLEALSGREQACATLLLGRGVARTSVQRFRAKEYDESIIAPFSPLLLSGWTLHVAFRL